MKTLDAELTLYLLLESFVKEIEKLECISEEPLDITRKEWVDRLVKFLKNNS